MHTHALLSLFFAFSRDAQPVVKIPHVMALRNTSTKRDDLRLSFRFCSFCGSGCRRRFLIFSVVCRRRNTLLVFDRPLQVLWLRPSVPIFSPIDSPPPTQFLLHSTSTNINHEVLYCLPPYGRPGRSLHPRSQILHPNAVCSSDEHRGRL